LPGTDRFGTAAKGIVDQRSASLTFVRPFGHSRHNAARVLLDPMTRVCTDDAPACECAREYRFADQPAKAMIAIACAVFVRIDRCRRPIRAADTPFIRSTDMARRKRDSIDA
jgi:hypothetical protein